MNYGNGWPGTNGVPTLIASGDPVLGTSVTVSLGNSLGATTSGLAFVGLAPASIPSSWGGTLLVTPSIVFGLIVPFDGLDLLYDVPADPDLAATSIFFQVWEVDSGASRGLSFTQGLELHHGAY